MSIIVLVLIALALAVGLALVALEDPGYILISRAPYEIEVSLALFALGVVLIFALVYWLIRVLIRAFRAPRDVGRWQQRRGLEKARLATMRGYAELIEGEWIEAENVLTKRVDASATPLLDYLGAAYAAQKQGNAARRDAYLSSAKERDPRHAVAVDIITARLKAQSGELSEARRILESLSESGVRTRPVQQLLASILKQQSDWSSLRKMLPVLRRSKALSDSEYRDLEQSVYAASLEAGEADTTEKAIQTWTAIPRKSRREPAVVAAYAQKLIETDDMARAEALLRASIKREWSSELVRLYGLVRSTSIGDQIKRAEEWKRQYPDDATLMLTLARLYLEKNDQEKGKEYLVAAVRNGGGQEAHLELGALLEVMGERDNALKCYRRGLEHLSDSEPGPSVSSRHPTVEAVPVLGVDSELGS